MRPTAAAASAVACAPPLLPQPELLVSEDEDENGGDSQSNSSRTESQKVEERSVEGFAEKSSDNAHLSSEEQQQQQQHQFQQQRFPFPMNTAELLAACSNTAGLNFSPGTPLHNLSTHNVLPPPTSETATTTSKTGNNNTNINGTNMIGFNASTSASVASMLLAAGFGQKPLPDLSETTRSLWKELEEFVELRLKIVLAYERNDPGAPSAEKVAILQQQIVQKLRETLPKNRDLLHMVQEKKWMTILLEWLNLHDRPTVQVEALFALTSIADLCQKSFHQQHIAGTGEGGGNNNSGMSPLPLPTSNHVNVMFQQHGNGERGTKAHDTISSSSGATAPHFPTGQGPFHMNAGYPYSYDNKQNNNPGMVSNDSVSQAAWNNQISHPSHHPNQHHHGGFISNFMNAPPPPPNNAGSCIDINGDGISGSRVGNDTNQNTNTNYPLAASIPQSTLPNAPNGKVSGSSSSSMQFMPNAPISPAMVAAFTSSGVAMTQHHQQQHHHQQQQHQPLPSTLPPPPAAPPGSAPTFGNSESSQHLLLRNADTIPTLVSLLSSPNREVHEQAMWILGNIVAGESPTPPSAVPPDGIPGPNSNGANGIPDMNDKSGGGGVNMSPKETVLAAGVMKPLLHCLESNPLNISLQRIGSWALSNLVETKIQQSKATKANGNNNIVNDASPVSEIDINILLPTLRRLLNSPDHEVLSYTCWALSHLCDGPSSNIAAVVTTTEPGQCQGGLVPRLVDLLLHDIWRVTKPALRTIGNIVCAECGEDGNSSGKSSDNPVIPTDFTEVILDCDAVPRLKLLISHENREIQKEACWTLSNIAAGTVDQIQAVIDSEAIGPLVHLVNNKNTDQEVRSEACWVVLNATSCGSDQQIEVLVTEGCVSVLGLLLEDTTMVSMALEGLERVLQVEEHRETTRRVRAQMRRNSKSDSDIESEDDAKPLVSASLIKKALEKHNTTTVLKRAERIWNNHFVYCELCHQSFSKHRTADAKFCNECKCYVCSSCNCEVYHLAYQQQLWADSEEKKKASVRAKKSKRQKKKEKRKGKNKNKQQEPKSGDRDESSQVKKCKQEQKLEDDSNIVASHLPSLEATPTESTKDRLDDVSDFKASKSLEQRETVSKQPARKEKTTGKKTKMPKSVQSSPTIISDEENDTCSVTKASDTDSNQPPIDFVLYLQQTGSIIALDKVMGAFYEGENHNHICENDIAKSNT